MEEKERRQGNGGLDGGMEIKWSQGDVGMTKNSHRNGKLYGEMEGKGLKDEGVITQRRLRNE